MFKIECILPTGEKKTCSIDDPDTFGYIASFINFISGNKWEDVACYRKMSSKYDSPTYDCLPT